jgi:dTDP-4-dehydrorhamnose reductase
VINAAAYTAVDKAEQEADQAILVNHLGAQNLAIACKKNQVPLIHLSTDYIFDGAHTCPYQEDDKENPTNVYGHSKWLGEQAVREQCEQHIILRVSGIFSQYGHNFLKTMLRLAQEKKELRVVADQITCPTYAGDIASVLFSIMQQSLHWGTYHYCNAGPVSWHQFATTIIQTAKQYQHLLVEEIKAISTSHYPTLAKRPAYSVLDCSKIENEMGIKQSMWRDALSVVILPLVQC